MEKSSNGICFSYETLESGRTMSTEKLENFVNNKRNNHKTARHGLQREITYTFPSDVVVCEKKGTQDALDFKVGGRTLGRHNTEI